MTIRTRFAPSPTGNPHLGNIRTALFSWLYAKNRNGKFVLRIEDTDKERSTKEATQVILDSMNWLGLHNDEGPFYQTHRLDHYRKIAEQLIQDGLAYRCYCSKERINELREKQLANKEKPKYDGCCRNKNLPATQKQPYIIRFKNDLDGVVEFEDQVLGNLSFQNNELDDLVLIRSNGFPAYNFCVVIDDMEMKISHVIRGADHINNTPRQINIFRALKVQPPTYAHVPLILGNDGKLLSKRHGATSILEYRDNGYLPEAVLNCLVRLGWSYGNQEVFSLEEMTRLFDIKNINKAAAAFDPEKLLWLNKHYIKSLDPQDVKKHLTPIIEKLGISFQNGPPLEDLIIAMRERSDTLVDMANKSRFFYEDFSDYEEKAKKHLLPEIANPLKDFKDRLENLETWSDENLHSAIKETAKNFDLKLGKIAQPVRVAITGGTISPSIDVTLRLLGKELSLRRIDVALNHIKTL